MLNVNEMTWDVFIKYYYCYLGVVNVFLLCLLWVWNRIVEWKFFYLQIIKLILITNLLTSITLINCVVYKYNVYSPWFFLNRLLKVRAVNLKRCKGRCYFIKNNLNSKRLEDIKNLRI